MLKDIPGVWRYSQESSSQDKYLPCLLHVIKPLRL
jgi:hypothetical protein